MLRTASALRGILSNRAETEILIITGHLWPCKNPNMLDNEKVIYPRINLKSVNLQHSRLYHLTPIGIGTPYVESLTGYVARLAEAHNLSAGILFRWEIGPAVGKSYLFKRRGSKVRNSKLSAANYVIAANGCGIVAKDWVRSLEALTMLDGLKYLTMLTWGDIISDRELLRPIRAWCPACYQLWHAGGKVIYEPLIWRLNVATACHLHRRRLRTSCHECNSQLHVISASARPGYCDPCGAWLGISPEQQLPKIEELDEEELNQQSQVNSTIGALFTAAPTLLFQPGREKFARAFSECLEQSATSVRSHAAQSSVSSATLNGWADGKTKPSLGLLLKFCRYIDMPVLQFMTPSIASNQPAIIEAIAGVNTSPRRKVRFNYEKTLTELESALIENPPPSMKEVLRRVGCYVGTLRRNFNETYKAILSRHQVYEKGRRSEAEDKMQQVLHDALEENPPPSLNELVRRTVLMSVKHCWVEFPDLCKAITARYTTKSRDKLEQIRRGVEDALDQNPPVSVVNVAKRVSCATSYLYLHFPDLCHRVAARLADYRASQSVKRKEDFRAEVRRIALMLVSKGLYPSRRRVAENLPKYQSLTGANVAQDELRKIRVELSIPVKVGRPSY